MHLTKELLISGARNAESLEELAEQVGWLKGVTDDKVDSVMERFAEQVGKICPGIELLLERVAVQRELERCKVAEDDAGRKEAKDRLIELTVQVIDAGLGFPMALAAPSPGGSTKVPMVAKIVPTKVPTKVVTKVPTKVLADIPAEKKSVVESTEFVGVGWTGKKRPAMEESAAEELRRTLKPCTESVDCAVIRGDVLGLAPEGKYRRRTRVLLFLRPRLFGREVVLESSVRQVTLHKGILNHCNLEECPSPYWAVLDAMSDLGKFTKAEVIDRAVELHGADRDKKKTGTLKDFGRACGIAYDVLKTHQVHQRKFHAGMSHRVVDCGSANPKDLGKAEIRGRLGHETLEYFMEHREKLKMAKAGGAPMASLEQ